MNEATELQKALNAYAAKNKEAKVGGFQYSTYREGVIDGIAIGRQLEREKARAAQPKDDGIMASFSYADDEFKDYHPT